jgi:prepilin-type N-terminal cleavage/methylation domain-containing protein
MLDSKTLKKTQGFSLLELMLVVSVMAVLAAITVPKMAATFNDIKLRYVATDLSGLLQSDRILSVKKNSFYTVQAGVLAGNPIYYIDKPATLYTPGDPFMPVDPSVTITLGPGTAAPNSGAFLAGLNFVVDPAADPPSFSARGLPCVGALNACTVVPGQGFVMFMSRAGVVRGNIPWVAVVVNPSGHIQVWSSDSNGNWIQRD